MPTDFWLRTLEGSRNTSSCQHYQARVYSHCIFCKSDFGRNQIIEAFPIGRRLAFDGAKGRLWVVCQRCKRWNLSPLEERWEAIETCERLYRTTHKRVGTENIGLARLLDGTDIVRIGRPRRPEFAAWRYGETLLLRRRKSWVAGAAVTGAGVGLVFGSALLGASAGLVAWVPHLLFGLKDRRTVTRLPDERGVTYDVSPAQIQKLSFHMGSHGWFLRVPHADRDLEYRSEQALRISAQLLPHVNSDGADRTEVGIAVQHIERHRSVLHFFHQTVLRVVELKKVPLRPQLFSVPGTIRLALEIAAHEEQERRALEGELAELESLWREAEEIANISDNLFLPRAVMEMFKRQKGQPDV